MASKNSVNGPVKAPLGSYPKLWRLLDHYFLKEDVPDRTALQALDTIVELNNAVLNNPKSANHRAIRSSEPKIRNLVEMGGTDILTEVGWAFKVMRMEECWVLPYDADLTALRTQQDKIVETQQKLKDRYTKSLAATTGRAEKEKAEKLAIVRQIEQDKAEREHRNALRSGAPPRATQSLDEIRKQAIMERMERDKARRAKAATGEEKSAQPQAPLPGTFPSETVTVSGEISASQGQTGAETPEEDDESSSPRRTAPKAGAPTGGRTPRKQQAPRRKKSGTTPIVVTKPVVKQRYTATENRLGGSSIALEEQDEGSMDAVSMLPSDQDDDDDAEYDDDQ